MHFILLSDIENDQTDAVLEGSLIDPEMEDYSFASGSSVKINKVDLPIVYLLDEYTLRGKMTDHLSIDNISGPVLSVNAKVLLEKIGIGNLEYFQLQLIDQFVEVQIGTPKKPKTEYKTIEYTNYFIANVVGLADCINHQKSIVEYFYPPELRNLQNETQDNADETNNPFAGENPNEIDFITKLVLDESKIDPSLKVFRLKDQPDLLVFHESVVQQIRKERLTGFVFVPVSEYTDAIPDDDDKEIRQETEKAEEKPTEQDHEPKSPQPKEEPQEPKRRRLLF